MNAQSMTLDPAELVIDLPIDENIVSGLMPSVQASGVLQPVFVWLNGMRIIDGFHRAVTAHRLGLAEIPAHIIDCDEEEFWSARILSARTHHAIEASRIAAWIFECWKHTKWYVPLSLGGDGLLPRAYSNTSLDMGLLEMVWTVFSRKALGGTRIHNPLPLTKDEQELVQWLTSRADQWGVRVERLIDAIMDAYGFKRGSLDSCGSFDAYARKYNLNFKQAQKLQSEITGTSEAYKEESAYVSYLAKIDAEDAKSFGQFQEERKQAKRDEYQRQEAKKSPVVNVVAQHVPTTRQYDEGAETFRKRQAEAARRRHVTDALKEIGGWVMTLESDLRQIDDGQALFAAFVTQMAEMHNRIWPDAETGSAQVDHYNEVAALKRDIESLRRALGTKSALHVTPNHLALSSSEMKHAQAQP